MMASPIVPAPSTVSVWSFASMARDYRTSGTVKLQVAWPYLSHAGISARRTASSSSWGPTSSPPMAGRWRSTG